MTLLGRSVASLQFSGCWQLFLVTSYLLNRTQYASVNGHISIYINISCGVPQGSVLGPLLFLLYINDLPNVSKHLSFYLFADDTNIYFEANDLLTLQKVMNRELRLVKKWLDANKLALNIDKTNFVVLHSPAKKLIEPIILKFDRKKISRANKVKFPGVLLDETLSWKPHLVELSRKLARSIGMFYKLRHFVPLNTLIAIYYALFFSFLTHSIVVWGATYDNYLQPVFTSQKKVIRAMTFSKPRGHSSPLFSQLKLLKLHDIYINFIFPLSFSNAKPKLHQFIFQTFSHLSLQFILTIPEVPPGQLISNTKKHTAIWTSLYIIY